MDPHSIHTNCVDPVFVYISIINSGYHLVFEINLVLQHINKMKNLFFSIIQQLYNFIDLKT